MCSRISELEVEDENEIKWEDLAGGWSSVRSPQWLRSKWWSIKRQVANHKEIPFSGTHKHILFLLFWFILTALTSLLSVNKLENIKQTQLNTSCSTQWSI